MPSLNRPRVEYDEGMSPRVVVIGAGPGGLAAAMLLAARGLRVQVFEKNTVIGGRNAELRLGDYSFDLGPTFLMMKFLLDEIFEQSGRKLSDYLNCQLVDPMYRLSFADRSMMVYTDPQKMRAEIDRVFPGEGAGLERFLARERIRFKNLYPCLQQPYESPLALLNPKLLSALPHIALGRSLYQVLADYFKSEELRLAFTFQSKYLGMSPWDCPGLFAMIPYTEHAHGIFHVEGGLCRISQAMATVAQEHGAEIHTNAAVRRVLTENRRAVGVELDSGERIEADQVVINADFGHAMTHLFEPGVLRRYTAPKLAKRKWSCSAFMMYLGLDCIYREAEHHMIVFARDYKKNLEDITHRGQCSEDFSLYIRNAAINDPTTAPPGCSALYILMPAPNNRSNIDWEQQKLVYREKILRLLEERTPYRNLAAHIREERILTPKDWEEQLSVYQGATFNLGHSWDQMLFMRPHNRFEELDHCYLVGGGTHPGSGLPTIFESARIASNMICDRYGVPHPSPKTFDGADWELA